MFSFGPFGQKKAVAPTDPSSILAALGKQVVDDPPTLNHNLREVCQHLGTPLHDRADQALGSMIALHASRMLPTLWTVLLQRLRESPEQRAQLAILKHFSTIAHKISIPQRANAFRAFAREVKEMLASQEIVGDRVFLRSMVATLAALGVHAEEDLCQALLAQCISTTFSSTRPDAKRNSAALVAHLVAGTKFCGDFPLLIDELVKSDKTDALAVALIVDACVPLMIEQCKRLCPANPQEYIAAKVFCRYVEKRLEVLLLADASETSTTTISINTFTKLKAFTPRWPCEVEAVLCACAKRLLREKPVRRVLQCPLISLLRWVGFSKDECNDSVELLEQFSNCEESLIRAEACSALEASVTHLPDELLFALVQRILSRHKAMLDERCNITIRGILGFVAAVYPRLQEYSAKYSADLVHQLIRAHLDMSNSVNTVPVVQQQMLSLIEQAVAVVANDTTPYVLLCLASGDAKVRDKSIAVLLHIVRSNAIERIQLFEPALRGIDFLEGSYCRTASTLEAVGPSYVCRSRNIGIALTYFVEQLSSVMQVADKESLVRAEMISEVLAVLFKDVCPSSCSSSHLSHMLSMAARMIYDYLSSTAQLPIDTCTKLIQALAAAISKSDGEQLEIYFHKSVFNLLWNLLHQCCTAIDPIATPKLPADPSLYLSSASVHSSLTSMIAQAAQSALCAGDFQETNLFAFIEATLGALVGLMKWARANSVFVAHMRIQFRVFLACLDVLAASNPVCTLAACKSLFVTMFFEEGEEPANEHSGVRLSATIPALQRAKYVACTVSILNRSLSSDLIVVGEALFDFISTIVRVDIAADDTQCYLAIDEHFALFKRIVAIATDASYYNSVSGPLVMHHILRTLSWIFRSPHSQQARNCSEPNVVETIRTIIDNADRKLQCNVFASCKGALIADWHAPGQWDSESAAEVLVALERADTEDEVEAIVSAFLGNVDSAPLETVLEFFSILPSKQHLFDVASVIDELLSTDHLVGLLCSSALDESLVPRLVTTALASEDAELIRIVANFVSQLDTATLVFREKPTLSVCESGDIAVNQARALLVQSWKYEWSLPDEWDEQIASISNVDLRQALTQCSVDNSFLLPACYCYDSAVWRTVLECFPRVTSFSSDVDGPDVERLAKALAELLPEGGLSQARILLLLCVDNVPGVDLGELLEGFRKANIPNTAMLEWMKPSSTEDPEQPSKPSPFLEASMHDALDAMPSRGVLLSKVPLQAPLTVEEIDLALQHAKTADECSTLISALITTCNNSWAPREVMLTAADALIRTSNTLLRLSLEQTHRLFSLLIHVLEESSAVDEVTLAVRYSAMLLLILTAPDEQLCWQAVLDDTASVELLSLKPKILRLFCLCLELTEDATISQIAKYVVSIFLRSSGLSTGINESILWMVVKSCTASVWHVIQSEELCQSSELCCIRFLVKLNQTVGMSPNLVQELHARYTPLLLSFGVPREMDADEQRFAFWLTTSLLLHTAISEERHTKPKPHMSLVDALPLYVDFPLAQMSLPSADSIRRTVDRVLFPRLSRMGIPSSERNWNIHVRGHLLPVGGRQSLSKAAAEKMFTSILHMYLHVVATVFENVSVYTPESLTDVFFSLSCLSACNASLLKHSPALEGTIASNVLQHLYQWYRKHPAPIIASVDSRSSVLGFKGHFPESSSCLDFVDTFSVISCATVVSSLFVKGNELIPGCVDVSFILEKMLCMDAMSHQAALCSVVVLSSTSTRKEMSRVAPIFVQRLFRDMDVCRPGYLSMSFSVLQLLRSAFSIVSAISDDAVVMKVCEVVWNTVIARGTGGRRVQYYAHFLLQSVVNMSTVSHAQWSVLRALVTTAQSADSTSGANDDGQDNKSFSNVASQLWEKFRTDQMEESERSFVESVSLAVRQTSISFGDPCGSSSAHRSTLGSTQALLRLTTVSSIILRSKSVEGGGDEVDRNRVQVLDLLGETEAEPSITDSAYIYAVGKLLSDILDPNDAMFVVLNKFNFSECSLTLFVSQLQLAVARNEDGGKGAFTTLLPQLSLFIETALRRQELESNCWWTTCVALCAIYHSIEPVAARSLLSCLCKLLSGQTLVVLARAIVDGLQLKGQAKNIKLLLKSMEASARTLPADSASAASTKTVLKTIQKWLDSASI